MKVSWYSHNQLLLTYRIHSSIVILSSPYNSYGMNTCRKQIAFSITYIKIIPLLMSYSSKT